MRIDAHQHFWKVSRGDYGWLNSDLDRLYRNFLPEDLMPHLDEHQIDYTILVQAAPTQEETDFLLQLYNETSFVAGVVGWLDLESPRFKEDFYKYLSQPGFIGIRPMLQDLEDDSWILRPQVMKNVEILVAEDFPIDILILPRHLPHILKLLEAFPTLRAVIDHAAKPDIATGNMYPWKDYISQIGVYEQVMCKLSGLITEADHQSWKVEDLIPYVQHVIDVFGPSSVLYGSDWPVCLLAGSYRDVFTALHQTLSSSLTNDELAAIFGENAQRFYRINARSN
jgi:L-fuconolactonase